MLRLSWIWQDVRYHMRWEVNYEKSVFIVLYAFIMLFNANGDDLWQIMSNWLCLHKRGLGIYTTKY